MTPGFFGLMTPLDFALVCVFRKLRLSAVWLLSVARMSGSLATVLVYQWFIALPSSPRTFLGCGPSLTSTLVTMPTTRTVRPRSGTMRSVPSGATSGEPMSVETRSASLTAVAFAFFASRARLARTFSSTTAACCFVVSGLFFRSIVCAILVCPPLPWPPSRPRP